MPFKPNDPKTSEIAGKGAKAKNKKYPENYRKWLFKKGGPRTRESSRKGVLAGHRKYPNIHELLLLYALREFQNHA